MIYYPWYNPCLTLRLPEKVLKFKFWVHKVNHFLRRPRKVRTSTEISTLVRRSSVHTPVSTSLFSNCIHRRFQTSVKTETDSSVIPWERKEVYQRREREGGPGSIPTNRTESALKRLRVLTWGQERNPRFRSISQTSDGPKFRMKGCMVDNWNLINELRKTLYRHYDYRWSLPTIFLIYFVKVISTLRMIFSLFTIVSYSKSLNIIIKVTSLLWQEESLPGKSGQNSGLGRVQKNLTRKKKSQAVDPI